MGVLKVYLAIFILFIGLLSCKPQQKKDTNKQEKIAEKISFKYPDYLNKGYVLGQFDYTKEPDFKIVPKKLSFKKIYIRKEVLEAFLKMQKEAKKDNIEFKIISGTRNFAHQKRIWDWKWNEKYKSFSDIEKIKKILEFSSMPGTSRHHWGTDIDINSLENSYFEKGKGKVEYDWLIKNAPKFGFYQVYTSKKNGRTGYNEEKWHWSYVSLSSVYLKFYNEYITIDDIKGFKGYEYAKKVNIIKHYVNGVNPSIIDKN